VVEAAYDVVVMQTLTKELPSGQFPEAIVVVAGHHGSVVVASVFAAVVEPDVVGLTAAELDAAVGPGLAAGSDVVG